MSKGKSNNDPQQTLLYAWETTFLDIHRHDMLDLDFQLPYDICRKFVKKVCAAYGVPPCKVLRHRSRSATTAYYSRQREALILPENWATTGFVVAHEVAHYLTRRLFNSTRVESHGAHFCRVYQNILSRFLGVNTVIVERSMLQYGLKLVAMSPLKPRGT